ncbi:MAG TPA: polysaccharide pyruvyl transferase family protein [Candidatus Cryosericum sp.]|nr:polysaccharide pyruvyl transferase family protein [Candidatus Cryosericum sp.]
MKRLLVIGYYGFGNFGDELILSGVQAELASLPCAATFAVHNPRQYAPLLCPRHNLVDRGDAKAMNDAVTRCDAVMLGGGGLVQDTSSWRSSLYYLGIMRWAALRKRTTIAYAQGIGPLTRAWTRRLVHRAFEPMACVDVRDEASRLLLAECGIDPARVTVSCDVGLTYLINEYVARPALPARERHIAACLNPRFGWTTQQTARFLDLLAAPSGATIDLVVLFPGSDFDYTHAVQQYLGARSTLVQAPTAALLADRCAASRMTVAGRYHMAAAAVAARARTVALAYDPKLVQLGASCGFPSISASVPPERAAEAVLSTPTEPAPDAVLSAMKTAGAQRIARLAAALNMDGNEPA